MATIEKVFARSIFDSRGNPTVEVDMWADGVMSRASVPSGASTGAYEAVELRDDSNPRYMGKGVQMAVDNVNKLIAPKLIGMDPVEQTAIDQLMLEIDGTDNKVGVGRQLRGRGLGRGKEKLMLEIDGTDNKVGRQRCTIPHRQAGASAQRQGAERKGWLLTRRSPGLVLPWIVGDGRGGWVPRAGFLKTRTHASGERRWRRDCAA
jgi:hypothetical protein